MPAAMGTVVLLAVISISEGPGSLNGNCAYAELFSLHAACGLRLRLWLPPVCRL